MSPTSFNLTGEPWIPVLLNANGETKATLLSLRNLFERAEYVTDFAVTPPQRVSLMRLLICITQAALDGPVDDEDWRTCKPRIVPAVLDYLDRHKDCFDLFGERPFLQVRQLTPKPSTPCDKLDFGLAAGNNHTLFDHPALGKPRTHTFAELPLLLLTYQCFSPGGLIGETKWNGRSTGRKSNHAPCVEGSPLLSVLRGNNALSTIHWNLVPKTHAQKLLTHNRGEFGRPIWELPTAPAPRTDEASVFVYSYLGRLVPLTRAILLDTDGCHCTLANGLEYPKLPYYRDPMATVIVTKETKKSTTHGYLRLSPAKHPWRDLSAVLTIRNVGGTGGPWALRNLRLATYQAEASVDLWVGGLAVDRAKPIDTGEWVFHIPLRLIDEPNLEAYRKGTEFADDIYARLYQAIGTYRAKLKVESSAFLAHAKVRYWSLLDRDYHLLVQCAVQQDIPEEQRSAPSNKGADDPLLPWKKRCFAAAHAAYREACPALTPRQIEAFVQGLRKLQHGNDNTQRQLAKGAVS